MRYIIRILLGLVSFGTCKISKSSKTADQGTLCFQNLLFAGNTLLDWSSFGMVPLDNISATLTVGIYDLHVKVSGVCYVLNHYIVVLLLGETSDF